MWAILRDFNGHDRWHPAVAVSRIEERRAPTRSAACATSRLKQGGAIREQLLSLSDRDHSFTYCILDAPMPLEGYVATVRLKPVTDGNRTFWHWQSEFKPPPEREAELTRMVGEDIYEGRLQRRQGDVARQRAERTRRVRAAASQAGRCLRASAGGRLRRHRAGALWRARGPRSGGATSVPPPGPGEVRLAHTAIGVNFIDVYCRTGYFDLLAPRRGAGHGGRRHRRRTSVPACAISRPAIASAMPARRPAPMPRCARCRRGCWCGFRRNWTTRPRPPSCSRA